MALNYVTIFCIALGFIHMAYGRYVIISPDTIRPGLPLILSMNIETEESFTIAASIKNSASPINVASIIRNYIGSTVDTIELQVPDSATADGIYTLEVLGLNGVKFTEEKTLQFVSKGFSIYIQTDKAIYKPGQTINYRIFAVNPDLSQRMVNYSIEIKDPSENLIQQWTDYQTPSTGVVVEELPMSTQPVLGDWSITATSGDVSAYQVFTIGEYVLPKFEVSVTLPSFITRGETSLEGRVDATYTYGKPVKGMVLVRITTGNHEIELNMAIDGSKSFSVPLDDFERLSDGVNFNVIAIVTESLTGKEQNSTASTGYFNRPVKVDILDGNSKTFKPTLLYTAYIAVTRQDGTPLSDAERSVPLLVSYKDRYTFNDGSRNSEVYYEIPSTGVVTAQIDASILSNVVSSIFIQARYYTIEEESGYVDDFNVDAVESPSNSFIQIILANSGLNAGEDATFTITSTEVPPNIVYMILSKGNIVLTGTLAGLTSTQNTLNVAITADMAPSAKLIAYYVRSDNETVVDVSNFNVDGAFKNQVSLSFSSDVVEPGDNINVDIAATGGSLVYLLAVDQSVLLLKSGNDITQQKVIEELETFDSSNKGNGDVHPFGGGFRLPWFCAIPTEGSYAAEIFDNSGVIVLTDAEIPEEYDYPFYNYRVYAAAFPGRDYFQEDGIQFDDTGFADEAVQETLPNANDADSAVRTEFPETWLWMEATVGVDGMLSIETTVPDTITSWVGSAFALSSSTGLGIVPTTSMVTVFKPFFVSMNLPYSVIRGENLALEILVFNYQTMDITAEIKLHKSEDFDNIEFHKGGNSIDDKVTEVYVSKDQVVKANIPAGEGVSVSYAIIPKNLKLMDIQVTAQSTNGRDSVIRQLLVEPEGVTEFYTNADLIDLTESDNSFTNSFLIDLPPNGLIDGSVYVKLATTGDIMGPTMSGLDELLRMPSGCGEQNMIGFAPDVFIYDYLTNTNQNNPEIKKKALDFMKIGYQRELDYKHVDGSFSAFGNRDPSGSTWLTAFVIKSFVQAQDYIFVDNKVVEKGITWLLEQQNTDGSFMEPGKICHRDMQGGVSGPVTLTAYVVVAIQEAKNGRGLKQATLDGLTRSLDKANAYIVGQFYTFNRDPYILAITTYALTLSGHAQRDTFLTALEALAIVEGGMKYWRRQDKNTDDDESNGDIWIRPYGKPPSSDVEMTGYGLLTYLARDDTLGGVSISKWLTRQRSEIGGYSSTQDTVVALQALASYAGQISVNRGEVVIDVTLSEDPTYTQSLIVNSDNALVFQQLEIPVSSGSVDVSASGSGSFLLQFSVMFNVQEVVEEPAFNITIAVIDNDSNNIQIQVCGQYLKDIVQSGMSIMEIGIPSGFVVDEDRIRHELEDIASLQKYEFQKRNAILYLDEIAYSFPTCVGVAAYRTNIVSNIKPSPVKLYNYYQPDEQVTKFYLPDALSNSNIYELCDTCGEAISLSAADTTPEPSAAVIQMTPHPLLNIATLIVSCFITGLMLGVNYQG